MLTLPELYLLVAHDPRGHLGFIEARNVQRGLLGASISELILRRRVSESLGRLRVVDGTPTGEPPLDLALGALAAHEGPPPDAAAWIDTAPRALLVDLRSAAGERLAKRGIVTREERTSGIGTRTLDFPPTDERVIRAIHARIRAVVDGSGSDRELALARVVDATHQLASVYPEPEALERAHHALVERAPEQPIADALAHMT